ncbi:MAG: hypothetical protein AXA67_14030 [Methylothermaceae bacteria B42]|nr:MAG: hypothetical protein AXA67_14030 [Methylothermaceae bacteria B42]HHJ38257.1 hypothetical protein [Methylothermaceae bacterium]
MNVNINSKYKDDIMLWGGILVVSAVFIGIFMVFTTTPPLDLIKKILSAILIMFLPGYIIMKLYLDDVKLSNNPAVDKFILSFGLSMVTVQSLAFIVNYFAVYGENLDQEFRIRMEAYMPLIIAFLVVATAFVLKFFWGTISSIWGKLMDWFAAKLGGAGHTTLLVLATFIILALFYLVIKVILLVMVSMAT